MNTAEPDFVDIKNLRIGLFVELDVGWMAHPFPTNSFKITSNKQIDAIGALGLTRVRFDPQRSDPAVADEGGAISADVGLATAEEKYKQAELLREQARRVRAEQLSAQQQSLLVCERRFGEATKQYRKTLELVHAQPKTAALQCQAMVGSLVGEILTEGESAIRLLTEAAGDKSSMHPVNVAVVSLLLGKAMGWSHEDLVDLGMAAFLHDVGKVMLPERVRWPEDNFSSAEYKLYQEHVAQGLLLVKAMGLSKAAQLTIAQHHELADGTGFPSRVKALAMSPGARILALVNRYDNLCNPSRLAAAMTPHEALALIFAQQKSRFEQAALSAFIRMMGVYPPGTVVQLVDQRFALVVSVNSTRPLKPRVLVHEAGVASHEALILDLEQETSLGVQRAIKPSSLPSAAMDFLAPRQRIGYFFETIADDTDTAAQF
jgi:HD-GYP domain-containing protein (c-di-GMP phosphodiesterase class II)